MSLHRPLTGEKRPAQFMRSMIVKRSVAVGGHKTSVTLEDAFWGLLKEIAQRRHMSLSAMIGNIDSRRNGGNLSSTLRLYVLDCVRAECKDVGEAA
jgi:predicted DNA-binding ribbon-helix-helix protein